MTNEQKDCLLEIQELFIAINETVKKYGVQNSFVSCLAVGFFNMEDSYIDDEGEERTSMHLLSSIECADDEELDELLSYCVEAHQALLKEEQEKKNEREEDPGTIDYWLKKMGGDGSVN